MVDTGEEEQGLLFLPFVSESVNPSCAGRWSMGTWEAGDTALEGRCQEVHVLVPLGPCLAVWPRAPASPGLHPDNLRMPSGSVAGNSSLVRRFPVSQLCRQWPRLWCMLETQSQYCTWKFPCQWVVYLKACSLLENGLMPWETCRCVLELISRLILTPFFPRCGPLPSP